jgi:hypothetical protein
MAGIRVEGNTSGNVAEVDATNNLKVLVPTTIGVAQTGFTAVAGRNDDGTIVAAGRVNRGYVTEGQSQKVTQPLLLWDDTFNATAQNTSKYRFGSTTQTGAQSGGFLILNNSSITTANTNSALQTFKTFPLFGKTELRVNISALFTQVPQANETYEWGVFTTATLPNGTAPTDGVFWRRNTSGELRGVINFNGTETQTAAITAPSVNVNHDYVIVIQTNTVLFYIDDILRGVLTLLTDAPTQGQPMIQAAVPLTIRYIIGASTPALASQIKVSDVFITVLGSDTGRIWSENKAGFGHMAYQGQNGGTMGTTGLNANNSNPAATVPTNTTAALGVGLGGKFQETLTLAAATDGIIMSFQNPLGSVTQTPRNLVIRGIAIGGVFTVAIVTSPLTGVLSLAYGHTAVSMATAESASFATPGPTAKAPRKIALAAVGSTVAAGVIGQTVAGLPTYYAFTSPVVVAPGEFIAITHCKITTAPTAGAIMWTFMLDAYFE